MNLNLPQPGEGENAIMLAYLSAAVLFTVYWFVYDSGKLKSAWPKYFKNRSEDDFIIFTKYLGFILLGCIPMLLFAFYYPGYHELLFHTGLTIEPDHYVSTAIWTLATGLPILGLSYLSAGNPGFQKKYPELRIKTWTRGTMLNYAAAWFFYLLGYEFLFRGILFLIPAGIVGFWAALALNLAVYIFTHIPKGADEAAGAGIIGVVLCFSAWHTGNIWPAVFIHVIMAWSGNYFAFRRNPEYRMVS